MTDDATPRDGPQRRPNADEVMKPVLVSVFVVLVVVGIAAAGAHYVGEPYNTSFLRHPIIVALHVVLGGVYLLLVPLQFVAGIRARRVGYHRGAGRVLVGVASIVGATALFMALVIPFSGRPEQIIVGFFAGFFLVALAKSVRHVRAGRVRLHREWMIRSVSVALSISTMRLNLHPVAYPRRQPNRRTGANPFDRVVYDRACDARAGGRALDSLDPRQRHAGGWSGERCVK